MIDGNTQIPSLTINSMLPGYTVPVYIGNSVQSITYDDFIKASTAVDYTASQAQTASYVGNALITASSNLNIITFTKGDGSTFPITVSSFPGGQNTQIQFNNNGVFDGSNKFTFISASGALTLTGSFNVTGSTAQTGNNTLIGNTVLSGSINISGSQTFYGTSAFYGNHTLSGSNTINGNTVMSGSIDVSGSSNFHNSTFIVTGSTYIKGITNISGSTNITGSFNVTDGNINIVSGSSFTRWGNKLFNYGQFSDTTTQSGSANTAYSMKFNTTDFGLGVSVVSSSRITVENTGIYNLQFSAQLGNTANSNIDFDIWFAYTGSNIANSTTQVTLNKVAGSNGLLAAAWNFATPIIANDYVEIKWSCTAATGQLQSAVTQSNPTRPAIPSVIATVTQIA
jgi:hypothetical protein